MKITRKAATGAVASLSLLALAACSSGSGNDKSDDSGINQSTAVNVAWESPLTSVNTDELNVGNATQNAVVTYLTNMQFNYYDPDLKLQRDTNLGTYEKVSDDPLTVKYTINKDAVLVGRRSGHGHGQPARLGRQLREPEHDRGLHRRERQRHDRLHLGRVLQRRRRRWAARLQDARRV